jgi:DNA-directed RNA polymerase subunit beta
MENPLAMPPGRAVDDPAAVRGAIFDRALATVGSMPPVASKLHTLQLSEPAYEGPEDFSLTRQKQALMSRQSVGRRLRATATLTDNATGQELARRRITLAQIPYYTDRGTVIDNGTEYTIAHQLRLKPGIYTREKDNGEIEAHTNILPGQGVPHRIFLEPKSGIFRIKVGQAQIPLVPLLQAMGVPAAKLREAWGNDLAAINTKKAGAGDLQKLYTRLVRNAPPATPDGQQQAINQTMLDTRLDPEVTRRTLGQPFDRVSPDAILATTRKLLAIHNRNNPELLQRLGLDAAEQDDRDHLGFMTLHGPEDIIAERLRGGHHLLRQVLWKAARKGNLDSVLTGLLTKNVRGALLDSGLAQSTEGINPAMLFDQQMRVSRMGYGGIPSRDSIPASSRSVQPSHLGYIDPVTTPESETAGVDSRMVRTLRKGQNGEIYAPFRDAKTGQIGWRQPLDMYDSAIAFPGPLPPQPGQRLDLQAYQQLKTGLAKGQIFEVPGHLTRNGQTEYFVPALKGGKLGLHPASAVNYQLPHMEHAFSPLANMVPGKSGMKGQRVAMAARMLTQSLPLERGEAPLVQSGMPDDARSYEELYGERMGAIRAKQGGRVLAVRPDGIDVQYADGQKATLELAQNLPNARKTYFDQQPAVQPGQSFNPGELLARSNYVDRSGAAALGMNVRTGYLPLRGHNFEDATVVSESLAKRLTSQHLYRHSVEADPDTDSINKKKFISIFPSVFHKAQIAKLDEDGVVRVGQRVEHGDPLTLVASKRQSRVGDVSGAKATSFSDQSETWAHHAPGIVTDVSKTSKGVTVAVKTTMPLQIGDKLSGRHGNKGVVAKIVSDHEMPIAADGKPLEFLQNPLGVVSRSNPAQVAEALLGKIAAQTGQPYKLKDFDNIEDLMGYSQQELQRHGMQDTEHVTDPVTGRTIPDVLVGNSFLMKLHHVSESKASARGLGAYTADETPARGGPEGSKTWGMLHLNALLSHGATGAIRDSSLVRGQKNPNYWAAVMSGRQPADPPVPRVYEKFVNQLRAAGINPVRVGERTHILAMTQNDIDGLAGGREVQNPNTVDWKDGNLTPIPGGLFDETLFGGAKGARWAQITLSEPMPSPVMEEPIRKLLGLTKDRFQNILAGKDKLGDKTGPQALYDALDRMNVDHELMQAQYLMKNGRQTARDAAVRKIGYLLGIQKTGIHPREWFWTAVPVLPPTFRPVSKLQKSNVPMVADANYLYRDLFETNKNLRDNAQTFDDVSEERLALYNSIKAVTGLGDPAPVKLQEQQVKGILKHVLGTSPKNSIVQRRLLGSQTDLVGRSTIIPNPDLDMDSVGIPEESAWKVYQPFIVRHMVKRGMSPMRAAALVHGKHPSAREALLSVMDERPVYIDRAPVLHRYGVMAFHPRLARGHNLETSPIVIKGFGGDYDGDAMQFHVPATDAAVRDAYEKMLPSRNLRSVSEFRPNYQPSQEYLGGLYAASTARHNVPPIRFRTRADAIRAFHQGKLDLGHPVEIDEES